MESLVTFTSKALIFENALRVQGIGHDGNYQKELLSMIPPARDGAWWRQSHALPTSLNLTNERALEILRDTLEWIVDHRSEEWSLVTTLELQGIARASLRIGAWKLLQSTLYHLFDSLRTYLPTPQRMSRATGLLTEWALASRHPDIAFIYSQESLAWGGEPHRIRSYMAYARSCFQSTGPRDEIDILLSTQAVERQPGLSSREIFGKLHEIRLDSLALLNAPPPARQTKVDLIREKIFQFFKGFPHDTTAATHLVRCTAAVMKEYLGDIIPSSDLAAAIRGLTESGRWRDRRLLNQIDPSLFSPLLPEETAFVEGLDQLSSILKKDAFLTPDSFYLDMLPTSISQISDQDVLICFLCCI